MMKKLLVLVFAFVSFGAYSQAFKEVNQKLYFKNATKFGDTLFVDSASVLGSGQFLKIVDTTASVWRLGRSDFDATDTSFFSKVGFKLEPKNVEDTIAAAGLDLYGISGSGNELRIGSDNRVFRAPIDTSFFNRGGSLVVLKTLSDTLQASYARINTIQTCVDSTSVFNAIGGFTGLSFTNNCSVNVITYSDTTSSGLQPKVITFGGLIAGSTVTLVGGFRSASADSSVVILDTPPFFLNGNDTLKHRESITLFIKSATEAIEVSRSDN